MALVTKVMQTTIPSFNIIRCDNKNLGLSDLCNFEIEEVDPPIWGQDVIIEEMKDDALPSYIENNVVSNMRYITKS